MSSFDERARDWDKDQIHFDRSVAIATELEKMIPLHHSMKALEYGAGTGILSFLLTEQFSEITLMDNSQEMINVCIGKTNHYKTANIVPLLFDLEHQDFEGTFDIIFNQMVMHHVNDVEGVLRKFYALLNPGGFLATADLYSEDGSFHGLDVDVHWGFDPEKFSGILKNIGFKNPRYENCFEIKRDLDKKFPVFLLVAEK